jgi:RND family efflux transporter MFP subunit
MSRIGPLSLLAAAAAGLAALALAGTRDAGAADAAAASVPTPPPLTAERVVAEGRLVAYPGAEVQLSAEVAGILVELPIVEKQAVRRGQLIARLRADDLEAERGETEARLAEVRAEIRLAETELARSEELLAKQVDTAGRRDRALRDLEVARAREATLAATQQRIGAEIRKRRIVSPIDGVVVSRTADPGETVEARSPIATIADLGRVRIEAEVDEFDAGRVRLGAPAVVRAEGYEGAAWSGTVEEIPDAVSGRRLKPQDPGRPSDARVLLVKVRLAEATPLKLGQRVEVEIRR